jgi:hypothetical protein
MEQRQQIRSTEARRLHVGHLANRLATSLDHESFVPVAHPIEQF